MCRLVARLPAWVPSSHPLNGCQQHHYQPRRRRQTCRSFTNTPRPPVVCSFSSDSPFPSSIVVLFFIPEFYFFIIPSEVHFAFYSLDSVFLCLSLELTNSPVSVPSILCSSIFITNWSSLLQITNSSSSCFQSLFPKPIINFPWETKWRKLKQECAISCSTVPYYPPPVLLVFLFLLIHVLENRRDHQIDWKRNRAVLVVHGWLWKNKRRQSRRRLGMEQIPPLWLSSAPPYELHGGPTWIVL